MIGKLLSATVAAAAILGMTQGAEAQPKKSTKPSVGIVYVEGAIMLGGAEPSPFGESGIARSSAICASMRVFCCSKPRMAAFMISGLSRVGM